MDITQRIVATFLLTCVTLLSGCQTPDETTTSHNAAANTQALVISTIKPVHALATAIAGQHLQTKQLIPAGASPHHYALKPSDQKALQQAAVVIRIDSSLETFLNKTFSNLTDTRILSLAEAPAIRHLKVRGTHTHDDAHAEHTEHKDEHGKHGKNEQPEAFDHYRYDMHLWLNPLNMIAMIDSIEKTFSDIDPAHADTYQQNAAALRASIQATDKQLQLDLAAVRQQPFMVFHDAWQHFEAHYGLNFAGAVALDASRQPGARHVSQIKKQLQTQQAACLFREPQFSPALLDMIVRDTNIRTAIIDPMGTNIPISHNANNENYAVKLLQETADRFIACLSDT